jgi:hypothetical protein
MKAATTMANTIACAPSVCQVGLHLSVRDRLRVVDADVVEEMQDRLLVGRRRSAEDGGGRKGETGEEANVHA